LTVFFFFWAVCTFAEAASVFFFFFFFLTISCRYRRANVAIVCIDFRRDFPAAAMRSLSVKNKRKRNKNFSIELANLKSKIVLLGTFTASARKELEKLKKKKVVFS
jgi:hypothetical protein